MNTQTSLLEKIATPVALLAVGICFIVWADAVTDWIALAFGVCALVFAVYRLIRFFKATPETRSTTDLLYIILGFATGILLISRTSFVKEAISFVVGVYIILSSAVSLLNISALRRKTSTLVGSYIWPLIGLVVGALCISGQFIIPNELARLTGVVLVIYALADLLSIFTLRSIKKQTEKQIDKTLGIQEAKIVKEKKKRN